MRRLCLLAAAGLLLVCLPSSIRPARAATVSDDELAAATLTVADVPGFRLAGDIGSDPLTGATREQHTRNFASTTPDGKPVLLTIVLSAPTDDNPCLPLIPPAVASGQVFSDLNDNKANFRLLGSSGVGDVDSAASWDELDTGINAWTQIYDAAFMRGRLSVYVIFRTWGDLPDFAQFVTYVQAQDARLQSLIATAPTSPLGTMLTASIPPPETASGDCFQ